jgi:hypothetical protein
MEMDSRYTLAQANLADRRAQAARARLVKDDGGRTRPVIVLGATPRLAGLRSWLAGLRPAVHRSPAATPSAR